MPVQRDIEKEKRALGQYQSIYKKNPSSSDDWNNLHKLAYPDPNQMPDEFKQVIQGTQPAAGIATPAGPGGTLPQTVAGSNLPALSSAVGAAQAEQAKVAQPNAALQVLQEAIRAKAGFSDRGIGESDLFKSLGVTGMGALGQSIAAQHDKLASDATNFQNAISTMAGTYKDMASAAKTAYDQAFDQWKFEAERLQKSQDNVQQHADAIDILTRQQKNAMDLEKLRRSNPSIDDIIKARDAGIDPVTGKPIEDTVFSSPSGDTYDVARYAVNDDGTPNMDHVNAMRAAAQKMGKLNTPEDITNYIQKNYPTSPITADMVTKASEKYGVDWETILATMVAETQMGTDGSKGSRENNFGNVGNTNTLMASGGSKRLSSPQEGVDAVAKTMSSPIYKRNQVSTGTVSKTDQIATDIFNGAKVNINELPTKDRSAVASKLQKLGEDAKAKGDLVGVMRSSAGGKDVSDAVSTSLEKAINVIGQIEDLQKTINKEATGPITGIIRSNNPYDKKAALIKAQLTAIVPTLARGVYGEVGVLTDNDIKQYSQTLPNLKSTEEISKFLLGATIRSVQRSIETKLSVQAGTGRDVSGLVDQYNAVKKQADDLLGVSGEEKGKVVSTGTSGTNKFTITQE